MAHRGSYRNCHLEQCFEWFSGSRILFGLLALGFCVLWYWSSRAVKPGKAAKTVVTGTALCAVFMVLNGAGLVGPGLCPEFQDPCRRSAPAFGLPF